MIFSWGLERSTYHRTCVRRVRRYLEKKYGGIDTDFERRLVDERITDAYCYNKKTKTWYLCEVKVNWPDLQKAAYQIHDTVFRFRKTHKGDSVVPVVAIPARLKKDLMEHNNWNSLYDMCERAGTRIWVIEQSTVQEAMSPKVKKSVKVKSARTPIAKKKTSRTKKTVPKKRAVKTTTVRKTKTAIKRRTSKTRGTKSKSQTAKKQLK